MKSFSEQLKDLKDIIEKIEPMEYNLHPLAELLYRCIKYGNTIYVAGNGGSAADANHFAGEILGRFKKERRGYSCVSLSADNATITAIANDYGFGNIYSRQLEGLFQTGDILLTLSSSGNSPNLIDAACFVLEKGGTVINLLGKDGGHAAKLEGKYNHNFIVPSDDTPRIQEMHIFILHYIAEYIEEKMSNDTQSNLS
jgi:D-sedoheptulose 7-phosphate isomerase